MTMGRTGTVAAAWRMAREAAGVLGLPLALAVMAWRLLSRAGTLRRADVVVLMAEGGFGHTIVGPDVARRLFHGRRIVFVTLSQYGRHNWASRRLWTDLDVLFVPYHVEFRLGGLPIRCPCSTLSLRWSPSLCAGLIRFLAGPETAFITLHEVYSQLIERQRMAPWLASLSKHHVWPMAYFRLRREIQAPPLRLPQVQRRCIQRALNLALGDLRPRGVCCLYLRQKGTGDADFSNRLRVGSSFDAYREGIQLLVRNGYQVLVTGDIRLSAAQRKEFQGWVVDAAAARVAPDMFQLYAATEADVFVGEVGGGTWLSGINGIPSLVLNAFPYFFGFPNAWMYFKSVVDVQGQRVNCQRMFMQYAYDYELAGMTVVPNSREEIRDAIEAFVEVVGGGLDADPASGELEAVVPEHTWMKQSGAKFSPAWIRRHLDVEEVSSVR